MVTLLKNNCHSGKPIKIQKFCFLSSYFEEKIQQYNIIYVLPKKFRFHKTCNDNTRVIIRYARPSVLFHKGGY